MKDINNKIAFNSHQPLSLPEKIALQIGGAVYPVWRDGDGDDRILVGTAFFAEHHDQEFLISARHNFTENEGALLKIAVVGNIYTLNDMGGIMSEEDDLWVAAIPAELKEFSKSIVIPSLRRKSPEACRFGTGTVFIGFPDSLNPPGKPFTALPISTMLETRILSTTNSLVEKIVFDLRGDRLFTADGKVFMDMPKMFGMSGGPAFSWYATTEPGNNEIALHYFLQGMIVAWQRRDEFITACNAARIERLADMFSLVSE